MRQHAFGEVLRCWHLELALTGEVLYPLGFDTVHRVGRQRCDRVLGFEVARSK